MKEYQRIIARYEDSVAYIELNRPEIRNAFDDVLIEELDDALKNFSENEEVRAVVLSGKGTIFCAGADMHWMRRMKDYEYQQNYNDAFRLSEMLQRLHKMPMPVIAKVQGAAVGGGVGLVAASDIVIASSDSIFSLSEVRLGLVPACISPYLLGRINPGILRGYFLTGSRFNASKGKEIGLVNEVVDKGQLDSAVQNLLNKILTCGPQALTMAKELLERIPGMPEKEWMEYTAKMIADLRISAEGQEGLAAFLEKRKPSWKPKTEEEH